MALFSLLKLSEEKLPTVLRRPLWQFYVTGVIILGLSGWLWWVKVYTAPTRVFWGAIANSLSTRSFETEISQTTESDSLKQLIYVDTYAKKARSVTQLKQQGTEVETEIIGTPTTDYTRYTNIASNQKDAAGKPVDTSNVLRVWAISDDVAQGETNTSGHQLYAQATLGIGLPIGSVPVPMIDLESRDHKTVMDQIRNENIYKPDFASVKREQKDGRQIYTYDVTIQTILYVRLMQTAARYLGLSELEKVDANTYSGSATIKLKMAIDARSLRLASVDSGQGFSQIYRSYNTLYDVRVPEQVISATELQQRLSVLQKQ